MRREVLIFIQAKDLASRGFARVARAGRQVFNRLRASSAGTQQQFATFGSSAVMSIMKVVAVLGTLVLVIKGAQRALKSFVQQGVMANAQIEGLKVTLATTFKDMKKATDALVWAQRFAAETPFQIPEIIQATVRLETYGIKAKDTLRLIGDMASVMGKPLMQAIEAIADAQVGELERLKEFGMTKRMLIEAGAAVNTRGTITDMKSLNDALIAIMKDRFEGGMERMSHTFRGVVSNLKDFWGTLQRKIAEPTFEVIKMALQDLLAWINKIRDSARFKEIVDRLGQTIARIIKIFVRLPEVFQLLLITFKSFIKALGNWEFAIHAVMEFSKFILAALGGALKGLVQVVLSVSKVIWEPLQIAFFAMIMGIHNAFDLVVTGLWHGIKWLIQKTTEAVNYLSSKLNWLSEQFSKAIPKWDIPPIPKIDVPFKDMGEDFTNMADRIEGRVDILGQVWEQQWRKTGEVASQEGQKLTNEFKSYMDTMAHTAEQTIIPVMKDVIPPEVLERLKQIGKEITTNTIPSMQKMTFATKKTEDVIDSIIAKSNVEIRKVEEKIQVYDKLRLKQVEMYSQISSRILELRLNEQQQFNLDLMMKESRYKRAGVSQHLIDLWLTEERKKFNESRLQQVEEMHARIADLTGQSFNYEMQQLEIKAERYRQLGADQIQIDQWLSLERIRLNLEANGQIDKSTYSTWQNITGYIRQSFSIARNLFRMLLGTSKKTWQEMTADILEWAGQLIGQYLIAKGLEMIRRAEGKKTHRDTMLAHAEDLTAMATKFALMGDIVRATAAGTAAALAGTRAAKLTSEIKQTEALGKKYVAMGLAVEVGTTMASEAMSAWGQRAEEARNRHKREADKIMQQSEQLAEQRKQIEEKLQADIIGSQQGAQVRDTFLLQKRMKEYQDLQVDPNLLQQWNTAKMAQIAGVKTPAQYSATQPLPVQVVEVPVSSNQTISAAPTMFPVTPSSESKPTFVQNVEFNGLVNFDNPEALRELARKLYPYWEELEENWEA